jgi:hypothetical protein
MFHFLDIMSDDDDAEHMWIIQGNGTTSLAKLLKGPLGVFLPPRLTLLPNNSLHNRLSFPSQAPLLFSYLQLSNYVGP